MHKNKKSALDSSINTIVILIIAMTALGLALRFTKGTFTALHDDFFAINEQLKNQINDYMLTNGMRIYFPSTNIEISKGESKIFGIGIKNKKDEPLRYKLIIKSYKDQDGNSFSADNWFQYADKERVIEPAESHIGNLKLIMPKNIASGSYALTLEIFDLGLESAYDSKDFFITVRG